KAQAPELPPTANARQGLLVQATIDETFEFVELSAGHRDLGPRKHGLLASPHRVSDEEASLAAIAFDASAPQPGGHIGRGLRHVHSISARRAAWSSAISASMTSSSAVPSMTRSIL